MTWVRLDDSLPTHPKMLALTPVEFALFVSALCYCNQHLTDGVLPKNMSKTIRFCTQSRAKSLLEHGVFCTLILDGERRYAIHDYHDYQPSKADVQADREATRERQKRWRDRHRNGVTNASRNAVTNGAPSRPVSSSTPTVVVDAPHGDDQKGLPAALIRILPDDLPNKLKPAQLVLVAAAWEANDVELRHSIALVESADNPAAYLIAVARRILPTKEPINPGRRDRVSWPKGIPAA